MASMAGVVNTFSTQLTASRSHVITSMAAPLNCDPTGSRSTRGSGTPILSPKRYRPKRSALFARRWHPGRFYRDVPDGSSGSRDGLASRPLTPLTARKFQRNGPAALQPARQLTPPPPPFPSPPSPPPPAHKNPTPT